MSGNGWGNDQLFIGPSSGCVTGWMMQIEDNISATLNGITPNVMSLKGWVLAPLSEVLVWAAPAWLTRRLSAVTASTIKSSENVTCQLGGVGVGVAKGWIVTLCQSPSSPYPWCPTHHRGKTEHQTNIYSGSGQVHPLQLSCSPQICSQKMIYKMSSIALISHLSACCIIRAPSGTTTVAILLRE